MRVKKYAFLGICIISSLTTSVLASTAKHSHKAKSNENAATISQESMESTFSPWMTGPLFAGSGNALPKGALSLQPYLYITNNYGQYSNTWTATKVTAATSIIPTLTLQYGLTDRLQVGTAIPYGFNFKNDQYENEMGDASLNMGYQIVKSDKYPNILLSVSETFPTGPYENLNPKLQGVDANGVGSYQTTFGINLQKMYHVGGEHYLSTRLNFGYTLPTSVSVKGFNAFGGGYGTDGTVDLANKYSVDLGLEYSLNQHWVPALDIIYTRAGSSSFNGLPGVNQYGQVASNTQGVTETLSVAPAIEYNFSSKFGVIAGLQIPVAGRNTPQFVSGIISAAYAL